MARGRNKDSKRRQLIQQLFDHNYGIQNNIILKLLNVDWKIMLSPGGNVTEIITPCHESLSRASELKCTWTLEENFTISNMFKQIKTVLKDCHDCHTAKNLNLHTYVFMKSVSCICRHDQHCRVLGTFLYVFSYMQLCKPPRELL